MKSYPKVETFLRNQWTWIGLILSGALLISFTSTNFLGGVGIFFLSLLFFPIGLLYWLNATARGLPSVFSFSVVYYAFVGFIIYKIKVSRHWVKFVLLLLLLLLATAYGCAQGAAPVGIVD